MGTPLAYLYSSIDSAKRKVLDALTNPMDTLRNVVDNKNLAAREHLEQLAGSGPVVGARTPEQQQNLAAVVDTLASGYSPAGILAGPRAKGVDNVALAYAMKDARKGRAPADIWAEHNWGKGPDGFWRTEINDAFATPKLTQLISDRIPDGRYLHAGNGGNMGPLKESFSHPNFEKAYPDIFNNSNANIFTDSAIDMGRSSGSFSRFGGGMAGGDIQAKANNSRELLDTVLHELQHGVQFKEGFAPGGNPSMFKTPDPREAFRLYQRLGGEAESRLVESRVGLNAQNRRQLYPWSPEYFQNATGVPVNNLILPAQIPAP